MPEGEIIASRMDNVAHAMPIRADMRKFIEEKHLSDSIVMPEDVEALAF